MGATITKKSYDVKIREECAPEKCREVMVPQYSRNMKLSQKYYHTQFMSICGPYCHRIVQANYIQNILAAQGQIPGERVLNLRRRRVKMPQRPILNLTSNSNRRKKRKKRPILNLRQNRTRTPRRPILNLRQRRT